MENIVAAIVFTVIVFAAAAFGAFFKPDAWFRGIAKPSWNPPDKVFAPVWTLLYLSMAASAWLVWKADGIAGAPIAFALFAAQLALNTAWSWLFFGRHQIGAALADIIVLWMLIVATIVAFWGHSPTAGALLLPYLAWVSFATVLNAALWNLNRAAPTAA